jgi:hypothetical protein
MKICGIPLDKNDQMGDRIHETFIQIIIARDAPIPVPILGLELVGIG